MKNQFIRAYAFGLLLLCVVCAAQHARAQDDIMQNPSKTFTRIGQEMPAFSVRTLDGAQVSLADLKGKVVLINFWATWCPPCLTEMPRLEKEVWQKFKSDEFALVAVAREQTEDEIREFLQDKKYTFPMASDPEREIYKMFASEGIPRSYVVSPEGKILFQSVGYEEREFDQMKELIKKELKKIKKPATAGS
ncbi:MAG: TlpA family protein disulfide reductase [Acidobacteria bacterium]|nr:TlpA family protein disulfide reductase [Acidobacteriota bacterium]